MVVYEDIGDNLIKAYSDAGFLIHGGMPEGDYSEAIDPADMHRTYIETDIPIEEEEEEPEPEPEPEPEDPDPVEDVIEENT